MVEMKRVFYVVLLAWIICSMTLPFISPINASSTTSLEPVADSFVKEGYPSSNYGSNDELYLGWSSSGGHYYTYVKFDLSSIPEGSTIVSAKLKLYVTYTAGSIAGRTAKAYRVTEDWNESDITWNNKPNNSDTETSSAQIPSDNNWIEFDVKADVQGFVDNDYDNYGWVIKCSDCQSNDYLRFASREYSENDKHPILEIEYTLNNTVTETVTVTETITTTQTINNTVYSTVTTTVANTTYYTTIYETVSPTYGNQTANYYVDLTNQLMPLIMVIGVICTMLSLLLSATKGR